MKVLIVGYGSIGKRHVKNLLKIPGVQIIVCTKVPVSSKKNNKRIVFHNNLKECLEKKPRIGFITNETSKHVKIATILAKKNMDLFIEKPLSHSLKGVKNLVNIIEKKKLISQMGCNFRFYPPIQNIKKMIEQKKIGRIISVQVENGSYLPDWHPNEDYSKGYAAKKSLGGGIVLTQIHEIDYLYWFFGKIDKVLSVSGKYSDLNINVEDTSAAILKFHNNIIGELHLDFFQRPQFKRCKIRGTKGIIEWESENNKLRVFSSKEKKWKIIKIKNNYKLTSKKKINKMYFEELTHFLNCIKLRRSTINPIAEGVETLKIALLIKK